MTTEAAVAVETPAQPNPAVFEPVTSEVKTDAEREYFKSRGASADALFKAPEPKPVEKPVTEATAPEKAVEPADGLDDDEISVNADGRVYSKKTGHFVPKSAFLRVKGELKDRDAAIAAKSAEAQKLRDDLIQARERLEVYHELAPATEKTVEKPADAEPDPQTDIFAWVKWAKGQLDALHGKTTKTEEQIAKEREKASLQSFWSSDVAKFQQTNTDFADAVNYGIAVRHKMLEAVGVKDQAVRQQRVLKEISDLVRETAEESKTNPQASIAAKLYEAAKALGYTKKATETKKDDNADALKEIARLSEAQAASQTLGKGGGSPVAEALTREKYSDMPDGQASEARRAYIAKYGRSAWHEFISGRR